ncbi:TPA: hypothetical protein ACQ73A_004990, partial [Escherichia coli]
FTGHGSNTDAFFFVILVRGQSPYKTPALFFPGWGRLFSHIFFLQLSPETVDNCCSSFEREDFAYRLNTADMSGR